MAINSLCAGSFVIMHMFSERFYYGDQFTFDAADHRVVFNDIYGLCDRKGKAFEGEDSKVISKIVLYLIIPALSSMRSRWIIPVRRYRAFYWPSQPL